MKKYKEIVAWDGEGYDPSAGNQVYALLAYMGDSGGMKYITDLSGLSTKRCLDFMLDSERSRVGTGRTKQHINVIYGGGYDINMILADLPKPKLQRLWDTGTGKIIAKNGKQVRTVTWRGYTLSYIPRKQFRVTKGRVTFTLYDAIGYSQRSFLDAIEMWLGSDYKDLDRIAEGKHKRGGFTDKEITDGYVLEYTRMELEALRAIEYQMFDAIHSTGLVMKDHYGAGSLAKAMMEYEGVDKHVGDDYAGIRHVRDALSYAYFGGRIEVVRYGMMDEVHHYDIVSAYPAAMIDMPSFQDGTWAYHPEPEPPKSKKKFMVWHVRWKSRGDYPFYPFPVRDISGGVYFPPWGTGWVWTPELFVALQKWPDVDIEILEAWEWKPATSEKPFSFIPKYFDRRAEMKRENDPAQLVLKLGLNSLYGKLAQKVGHNPKRGKTPPYFNYAWAGWITSSTRAKLVEHAPFDGTAMFATDGLFSLDPIPELELGKKLGMWEQEPASGVPHERMMIVQAGVYFIWDDGKRKDKYRGWGKDTLYPERILAGWRDGERHIPITLDRFVGMGLHLHAPNTFPWRVWHTFQKELALHPTEPGFKRMAKVGEKKRPEKGPVLTAARPTELSHSRASKIPGREDVSCVIGLDDAYEIEDLLEETEM